MPVRVAASPEPSELAIDYRPLAALVPYARNARTHSEAQVALIAGSIREFGFTNPVLVDGGNGIVAGHGRVLAARSLGMTSVPVIELAHLSEAQKRAASGHVQQSPWIGIANRQMELMGRYMTELGLTPAARSRVMSALPVIAPEPEPVRIERVIVTPGENGGPPTYEHYGCREIDCKR